MPIRQPIRQPTRHEAAHLLLNHNNEETVSVSDRIHKTYQQTQRLHRHTSRLYPGSSLGLSQYPVQLAAFVAFQVQRHIGKSKRLKRLHQLRQIHLSHKGRDLLWH